MIQIKAPLSDFEAGNVLLACLTRSPSAEQRAMLDTTPPETWTTVVTLAQRYGVAALLHNKLAKSPWARLLPAKSAEILRNTSRDTAVRNLLLSRELKAVLHAFAQAEIPVIVLKGAYLIHVVYRDIALRAVADIDLLVHKDHLLRAAASLEALGYQPEFPILQEQVVGHHLPKFIHADHAGIVEIHWRLFPLAPVASIAVEDLWQRAVPITFVETPTLVLSPEDLLLHLCCHAVYVHRLAQDLRFLVDIAMVVEHFQDTLNWQVFAERAHAWRCARGVYLALFLARQLIGVPIPSTCLATLVPRKARDVPLEAFKALYFTGSGSQFEGRTMPFTEMMNQPRLLERFHMTLKRFFLPRDQMSFRYGIAPNSPRIYLYYLRRGGYLIRRYLKAFRGYKPEMVTEFDRHQELLRWLGIDENP